MIISAQVMWHNLERPINLDRYSRAGDDVAWRNVERSIARLNRDQEREIVT